MQISNKPTSTLAKEYSFIYYKDPSLDPTAEGFSKVALEEALEGNHRDRIAAWTKPGKKGPTEFTLRHLSSATMRAAEGYAGQHGLSLAFARLTAMALVGVSNPDGQPVTLDRQARDPYFNELCLTEEVMEMLERAGCNEGLEKGDVVTAIGAAVWKAGQRSGN